MRTHLYLFKVFKSSQGAFLGYTCVSEASDFGLYKAIHIKFNSLHYAEYQTEHVAAPLN